MYKAIILDMDGLMFDTERLWEDAFYNIGKKYGQDLSADFHRQVVGTNYNTIEKVFKYNFGNDFPFANFIQDCRNYMDNIIEKGGLKIKKGLLELLEYLKKENYLIAIASSSEKTRILWYLDCAKINKNMFKVIVSGEDILNGKPDPDIFIKTCKLLNILPEESLVLEDSANGVLSSSRANCDVIWIPDIVDLPDDIKNNITKKLDSLLDVIEYLENKKIAVN